MDFNTLFQNTSDQLKLKYLNKIINTNAQLQQEFMQFVGNADNPSMHGEISCEDFANQIEDVQTDYIEEFGSVDFENPDWDNYKPSSSGYMADWEQSQEAIEQEFDRIFEDFYDDALDAILSNKTEELTAMVTGLYKAACNVDIPDEYDLFPELNEFLLERHESVLERIILKLRLSSMPEPRLQTAIALLLRYGSKEPDRGKKLLSVFEDYLIALAEKVENPGPILSSIHESGADLKALPKLIMLLNINAGNVDEWLKTAKQFYREDTEVALRLLQYYYKNDTAEYLQLARELFLKNKEFWAHHLKVLITPENDLQLFVEVYCQRVIDGNSMDDYQKLRPHLSPERLDRFLNELAKYSWSTQFAATLLAAEKRYDIIKSKIEKNSLQWAVPEVFALLVAVYPEFCFTSISENIENIMQFNRNRRGYNSIAQWLKVARTIPGYQTQSQQLINELYHRKPSLPALRDEMREAGVV